jgi:hypothetical protein
VCVHSHETLDSEMYGRNVSRNNTMVMLRWTELRGGVDVIVPYVGQIKKFVLFEAEKTLESGEMERQVFRIAIMRIWRYGPSATSFDGDLVKIKRTDFFTRSAPRAAPPSPPCSPIPTLAATPPPESPPPERGPLQRRDRVGRGEKRRPRPPDSPRQGVTSPRERAAPRRPVLDTFPALISNIDCKAAFADPPESDPHMWILKPYVVTA